MGRIMDSGCGIYRSQQGILMAKNNIAELIQRANHIKITDKSNVDNSELISVLEFSINFPTLTNRLIPSLIVL